MKQAVPFAQLVARMAGIIAGMPDYETYVEHRRRTHPGQPIMSRAEFVADRQEARYNSGQGRGCC